MIRPKFKNNFPNAAVGNARLFNRGLCLGGKSVGQNEAKRRMIRPKRLSKQFSERSGTERAAFQQWAMPWQTFLTRGKSVGQNEAKRSKKDCEGAVRR